MLGARRVLAFPHDCITPSSLANSSKSTSASITPFASATTQAQFTPPSIGGDAHWRSRTLRFENNLRSLQPKPPITKYFGFDVRPVSTSHVKKPDLLRMGLVEHMHRLRGRLQ